MTFFVALFLGALLPTHSESIFIEAGKAVYQGKAVKMDDQISVEMGAGKKLTCHSAEYDLHDEVLQLHGGENKIHYSDDQLALTCNEAKLNVGNDFQVQHLETSGDLEILYENELTIEADNADYKSGNDGFLQLTGREKCCLKNSRGDLIYAKTVTFHPNENTITVENPVGSLATEPFPTHFEANKLVWDRQNENFHFVGDIKIRQNKLGTIAVSDTLDINKKNKTLHAEGAIEIAFLLCNALKCTGTLDIDHFTHTVAIHSPEEHIVLKDARGEIKAHRAVIHYLGDNKPLFLRLVAEDDVRINSFATVDDVVSETYLHTILTDYAELNAGAQSLTLRADEGKRTLLYDHVNHLQVSAPSLKVQRDVETHKDKIEGLGDVRFSFTEQELERLKQQLSWIK
jgi:lipopolysaccharide export system protein LptA